MARTSLDQWAVLAAVVDERGFARAAKVLNRSQSAVSYRLARLQEALDLPLFVVEGRRGVLTAHGATLLKRVRPLLRDIDTVEALARSLKQGWEPQLKLVVDVAYPRAKLLTLIGELQQRCANTDLQVSDAVLSGAEQAITDTSADVVVTTHLPTGHLGDWLLEVRFMAVASPTHALFALNRVLATDDLVRHVQVVVRDSGTKHPRDEGWLGAERRYTVNSMEASLATVEAGLAYGWLPEHLTTDAIGTGRLKPLPLSMGGSRSVPLYLVLVSPETAGPAARTAIEIFLSHRSGPPVP